MICEYSYIWKKGKHITSLVMHVNRIVIFTLAAGRADYISGLPSARSPLHELRY